MQKKDYIGSCWK